MAGPAQRFHWLRLRATAHATEDPDRVAAAMAQAAGDPDLVIDANRMESHHGGQIVYLEAVIERQRAIRDALEALLLPGLSGELERRMDDDGVLYWRLDKQAAFGGENVLVSHDDAIQVRCRIEVHPVKRAGALAAWSEQLQA